MTLLALAMQLGVLYVPAVARAFSLSAPGAGALAATAGFGVAVFLVLHAARALGARHGKAP